MPHYQMVGANASWNIVHGGWQCSLTHCALGLAVFLDPNPLTQGESKGSLDGGARRG